MRTAGVDLHVNGEKGNTARLIYLGVPTFGRVSIRWHAHMLQLQAPLNRSIFHGYGIGFEVGQARNFLVDQALKMVNSHGHTVSHLFFVDDDVLIPPDAISRLLAHHRPIVSGLYYAKTAAPQPLVLTAPYAGVAELPKNGLVECYAHGMGCTLIELQVFRELLDKQLVTYETIATGQSLPQFFKTTKDERSIDPVSQSPVVHYQTEDVFFLEKAAQLGYRAAVDVDCFCWHWDEVSKQAFPLVRPGAEAA